MRKINLGKRATAISLFGFLMLTMVGCNKSNNNPPQMPESTLKFSANGTPFQWQNTGWCGLLCGSSFVKTQTGYVFGGNNPSNFLNSLSLLISSTSLSTVTYYSVVANPVNPTDAIHKFFNDAGGTLTRAASSETGDSVRLTITQIRQLNGLKYADGHFYARLTLSPYGPAAPKLEFLSGEFYYLPIFE